MIRLVWIDKETKAWGSDPWLEISDILIKNLKEDKLFMEEHLPQYEYHIEERK